jgi:hypothetical protein
MVALLVTECVSVRATVPGEGAPVAGLWRELCDTLEAWGGYSGSGDLGENGTLGDRR